MNAMHLWYGRFDGGAQLSLREVGLGFEVDWKWGITFRLGPLALWLYWGQG